MGKARSLVCGAVFVMALAACSGSTPQAGEATAPATTSSTRPTPAATSPPATAAAATATPTPTATATPSATPTPDLLEELDAELISLGIEAARVDCIHEGLDNEDADRDALESAELDAVILLDKIARLCEVDLVTYLGE